MVAILDSTGESVQHLPDLSSRSPGGELTIVDANAEAAVASARRLKALQARVPLRRMGALLA
jgi:hypothetical protein